MASNSRSMGVLSLQLFKPIIENCAKSYCACRPPSDPIGQKSCCQCKCGEADCQTYEWYWDNSAPQPEVQITQTDRNVVFHPVYSQGTGIVRGTIPLASQMIHYWEIKILTPMSGTDFVSINFFGTY